MKRLLTILLSGLLILSLAACGGGGGEQSGDDPLTRDDGGAQQTQGGTENSGDTAPDIDFGSIMAGNGGTDTVWGQQDAATKQALIDAAKEDGMEASFGADGTLTIRDPQTGEIYGQNPDGTWFYQEEDGDEGQVGGNWPDNEFTKLLPKPDFEIYAAGTEGNGFAVVFSNPTVEQMREYAEKVKAAGFTDNLETEDYDMGGMVMYNFTASNAEGYTLILYHAAGTAGMSVEKP